MLAANCLAMSQWLAKKKRNVRLFPFISTSLPTYFQHFLTVDKVVQRDGYGLWEGIFTAALLLGIGATIVGYLVYKKLQRRRMSNRRGNAGTYRAAEAVEPEAQEIEMTAAQGESLDDFVNPG